MADHKSKADLNAMSVAELKKYLQERGISASGYLKNLVSGNHLRCQKNGSASGSKFRKGDVPALGELIIHDMRIP